ncbi:hypothetical protein M413DRAFT_432738 [Hebeloma cylindrosporum]|uniref:Uncharacterized protein n=1 Tax=Hebeloma cylindrosporum TaxID=76867 RepID=A0A0C3BUX8_HEBCY|nr:hypothetical protein M413DRAFT_432738 [Hebeloma cylindrosporum h7]
MEHLNNVQDPTTGGAPRRRNQRTNSAPLQSVLPEADYRVISAIGELHESETAISDLEVLQNRLHLAFVASFALIGLYMSYMLLMPPAVRCESLLFIIRGLQTLRRRSLTTTTTAGGGGEPSANQEIMLNMNPSVSTGPVCHVPPNALDMERRLLTMAHRSLTTAVICCTGFVYLKLSHWRRRRLEAIETLASNDHVANTTSRS